MLSQFVDGGLFRISVSANLSGEARANQALA